ncbi:putative toxin-antitoxin system toxin component, PIN family [Candidatus Thiosymbion oneisti]|uniref:putative toxin-antitoxin system toxin component, PIN family n=1 Tax=Candidatus Thiosymbion oneisti TaxID=589554 RepID=UPI0010603EC7|nr:putative toxin-antitoxin system toxin component, PIN family [Candidatus Thiosymbion oneisti]
MIVTLDTNVLLAALLSRNGASHLIIRLIIEEKLNIALTTAVVLEYDDVLKRTEILEKLDLTANHIEDVIDLLVLLAEKHSIYYRLRPNLPDENDNLFVECAFTSNSRFLITSNVKDFRKGELKSYPFKAITPGDFYHLWRRENE